MSNKKETKSKPKEKAPVDEATLLARQIALKKILLTVLAMLGVLIIIFAIVIIVDNKSGHGELSENSDGEISWLHDIAFGDSITYEDVKDYDFTCYVSSNKDNFEATKAIEGKDAVLLYSLLSCNEWKDAKQSKPGEDMLCLYFCFGKEKDKNAFQQVYIGDNNEVAYTHTSVDMNINIASIPEGVFDAVSEAVGKISE